MLTPEQYLELDRKAERKSEYLNGEMFAMAGASRPHNLIVTNTARQASSQLRSRPCEVYQGDMRVRANQDTLLNPKAIIEILSPSTEAYDHGRNLAQAECYEKVEFSLDVR